MEYLGAELESVRIPRQYSKHSFAYSKERLEHVFCDASKDAIGAVAYLQLVGPEGSDPTLSFQLGNGKLSPSGGNTIPRMELCASVLGIEVSDIKSSNWVFHQSVSDSSQTAKLAWGV